MKIPSTKKQGVNISSAPEQESPIHMEIENALFDQRLFMMNNEQWDKFQEILNRPAKDNPELQKLFNEKAPWE